MKLKIIIIIKKKTMINEKRNHFLNFDKISLVFNCINKTHDYYK